MEYTSKLKEISRIGKLLIFVFLLLLNCTNPQNTIDIEGFMDREGVQIYYHQVGRGEPIIFIHGGPSLDHGYFLPHMNDLASDFLLTYFDLRASGRSSANVDEKTMSIDLMIEDIEALRNLLNYNSFHLIAHSWGGFLAMKYALRYPGHLKSLILINSVSANSNHTTKENEVLIKRNTAEDSIAKASIIQSEAFQSRQVEAYEDLFRLTFKHQFKNEEYLKNLQIRLPEDIFERSQKFFLLGNEMIEYNFENELNQILTPTLVISGDYDPSSEYGGPVLGNKIPNAESYVMPESGHFPFIEQKAIFFEKVAEFINQHKG